MLLVGRYARYVYPSKRLPLLSRYYPSLSYLKEDYSGPSASDLIYNQLLDERPALIAKVGSNELSCIATYISSIRRRGLIQSIAQNCLHPFHHYFWRLSWDQDLYRRMEVEAGFYPADYNHLARFAQLHIEAIPSIDIYASWRHEEGYLAHLFQNTLVIPLNDIAPFRHMRPWSLALSGQKVLVIHPFAESIINNYRFRREHLWRDRSILPDMQLSVLKAVQTSAGAAKPLPDWFACLDYMKELISASDFSIAIIGAGAYSLPLGFHVKSIGRRAIVLGGLTQIMFGIWGSRWNGDAELKRHKNSWWTHPLPDETPPRADLVEGGCYW